VVNDGMMTLPEAARLLRCGYNVVWRLALVGTLRGVRRGARLLVNRKDVEQLARCWKVREQARAASGTAR